MDRRDVVAGVIRERITAVAGLLENVVGAPEGSV
jgi:hypothetical protein